MGPLAAEAEGMMQLVIDGLDDLAHPSQPTARAFGPGMPAIPLRDRKSTRLNSSHVKNSYAVICLQKKRELDEAIAVAQKACELSGRRAMMLGILASMYGPAGRFFY